MNHVAVMKSAVLLALLSATLIAPISAQAQSGKRMCGKWTTLPNGAGNVGLLVEMPSNNGPACAGVQIPITSEIPSKYFSGSSFFSELSTLTWVSVTAATCESIGKNFVSADHTKEDMCQYMTGQYWYTVVKDSAKNTTIYTNKGKVGQDGFMIVPGF